MNIKVYGEKFRVEYEGGTYDPGDLWTPPYHEEINIVSIEWKQNDRYIDVTDLLENELLDLDLFIDVLSEELISMNEPTEFD